MDLIYGQTGPTTKNQHCTRYGQSLTIKLIKILKPF